MKYSKRLILTAGTATVIGTAGIGATALAANNGNSSYPPIVNSIAGKFGLDPAKVDAVFKQQHKENNADRQAHLKSTLDQAVKDGKLTRDQEDSLLSELKTLHSQHKAESKADHQKIKTELEQWAKDKGISDLKQILPPPPHHPHF